LRAAERIRGAHQIQRRDAVERDQADASLVLHAVSMRALVYVSKDDDPTF
jgi:hypothetical protein